MLTGSCLCGGVRFHVKGPLPAPIACHCSQCRKQSGHFWAASHVPRDALAITHDAGLRWYPSSPDVRRGFCGTCGAFLFWDKQDEDMIDIAMGAFDDATGARLAAHIFVADKDDYYDITDGLPQYAQEQAR